MGCSTPGVAFLRPETAQPGIMGSGEGLLCVRPWASCLCESHFVTCKMGTVIPPAEDGVCAVRGKDRISQTYMGVNPDRVLFTFSEV